ncbi:ATP-binding protein, partial [Bacteroides salyersiae]|uniref:ATP-binding protein n=1 Tax=Bacteroides salyersiae TaxID=291644 RepID=UPI001F01A87F
MSRSNEVALGQSFTESIAHVFNTYIPEEKSFSRLFEFLMELGKREKYNLVIDEFQEFFYINPEVYSRMQDIWDRYRKETHVNLVVSGSVYTLMNKIFRDYREPLYGRADSIIKLSAFATPVLKRILSDYKSDYTNDDLLALYTFTGGVPKYIEFFVDKGCTNMESMVDAMLQPDSIILSEGRAMLIQELGKKYGNYFSLLAAIASGSNTFPVLEDEMGKNMGGLLNRLEIDYELVKKKRPIMAKDGAQAVRYEISDLFLRFWFRYFIKYQRYIEVGNLKSLSDIIKQDYPTYSGQTLEYYFRQQMAESFDFEDIGSWWEGKKNSDQHEIDIVGIYTGNKKALVAEVKRQRKNFKPEIFQEKVDAVRKKVLYKYE